MNRKYRNFYIIVFLTILFSASCRHDPEEVIREYFPIIELQQGSGKVFSNTTIAINEDFNVSLKLESNKISVEKLHNLKILRISHNDTLLVKDTVIDSEHDIIDFTFTSASDASTEEWKFTVYDTAGKSASTGFLLTTVKFPPVLKVIFEKNYIPVGSAIKLAIHAKSNDLTLKSLKRLVIKRKSGSFTMVELDSTFTSYELNLFKEYAAQSGEGNEEWEITITDAANEETSSTYEIYTVVLMDEEHYGEIWNMMGSNNHAWDLVNNMERTISDPDTQKDMANLSDSINSIGPDYFLREWSAKNNTLFKRANQLDYNNVSLVEAIDAFSGGSISVVPNPNATGLEMGDIYVAKLRDSETYVVIQIVNVIVTNTDHLDKIEFRYKK